MSERPCGCEVNAYHRDSCPFGWTPSIPLQRMIPGALDDLQFMKAPPRKRLFGLDWEYDRHKPRFHRFGVADGCRGVGNQSDPVTAYLALRRWRKVPARPS